MKSKKEKTLKQWLVPKLRKISSHWPNKNKALALARVKVKVGEYKNGNDILKSMYRCEICQELYDSTEIQIDHRTPVIGMYGFDDWNVYIESLFCGLDNLGAVCKSCHFLKTQNENDTRRKLKK